MRHWNPCWLLALALGTCVTTQIVAAEPPPPKQDSAKETPDQEFRTAVSKALPGSFVLARDQKHPCCVVPRADGTSFLFRNEWGGECVYTLDKKNPLRLVMVDAGQWQANLVDHHL